MKFVCDDCGAQYMIADEKVGPKGVKVKCKKCSHVIVVRPAPPEPSTAESSAPKEVAPPPSTGTTGEGDAFDDAAGSEPSGEKDPAVESTVVVPNPLGAAAAAEGLAPVPMAAAAPPADEADQEIGDAFDNIFGGDGSAAVGGLGLQSDSGVSSDPFSSDVDDAFDAALGAPAADGPDEHDSTRVFNTNDMQRVAEEREFAEEQYTNGNALHSDEFDAPGLDPAGHEGETDEGTSEWYIAISDEQVGPLTIAEVKEHFESGDVSADSLCWRAGMADWDPLSSVDELKHVVAPTPGSPAYEAAADPETDDEELAGAVPPESEGEPEWKPAAASLLASLAADEMDALDDEKNEPELAAPTADPVGVGADPAGDSEGSALGEGAASALNIGDLPPPPPSDDEDAAPMMQMRAPTQRAALMAEGALESSPRPPPAYNTVQVATMPPPALGGAPGGLTMGRLAALGGGLMGGLFLLIVLVLFVAGVFDDKEVVPAPVVAQAPPVSAPATTPTETPTPVAAAEPAPTKPTPAVAVKEAAPTAAPTAKEVRKPKGTRGTKGKARPKNTRSTRTVARVDPPPTTRKKPPKDDDLEGLFDDDDDPDDIFGSGSRRGSKRTGSTSGRPTRYIPPAPGAGRNKNVKKSLGKGDIIQVVAQSKSKLKVCAEKQKAAKPGSTGKLVMSWKIQQDGRTSAVKCVTASLKKSPFCRCMKGVIKKMRFPRYGGPQMAPIEFPFGF